MTIRRALGIGTVLALIVLGSARGSSAYDVLDMYEGCEATGVKWKTQPAYEVNFEGVSLPDGLGGALATSIFNAVKAEVDSVDAVGGQSFAVSALTKGGAGQPIPDPGDIYMGGVGNNGKSQFSFTMNWLLLLLGVVGYGPVVHDSTTCEILEGDVVLQDPKWYFFGVPKDVGKDYFDTEDILLLEGQDPPLKVWARSTLLHEFLHDLGFAHVGNDYSIMNYGVTAWTNNPAAKQMEPYADDREGLRAVYPQAGAETDVAITNTWVDVADFDPESGTAQQKNLCKPSGGSTYAKGVFSDYCGEGAIVKDDQAILCPGKMVWVRYATSNYGTSAVAGPVEEFWLSEDTVLDVAKDLKSGLTHIDLFNYQKSRSYQKNRGFVVPKNAVVGKDYFTIIRLNGAGKFGPEESVQNNWIPLRGKARIGGAGECS